MRPSAKRSASNAAPEPLPPATLGNVNASADVLDRPVDVEAQNTRPRFSGSNHRPNRRSRRAMSRRCKARSTTTRAGRGKSGLFLNNRHYDPTTGVFVSVDPLVTKTMQPYIYGAANPVASGESQALHGWIYDVARGSRQEWFVPQQPPLRPQRGRGMMLPRRGEHGGVSDCQETAAAKTSAGVSSAPVRSDEGIDSRLPTNRSLGRAPLRGRHVVTLTGALQPRAKRKFWWLRPARGSAR